MAQGNLKLDYSRACDLFKASISVRKIAFTLGRSRITVTKWKSQWENEGGVEDEEPDKEYKLNLAKINIMEDIKESELPVVITNKSPYIINAILERAEQLIPKEENLQRLAAFFKAITSTEIFKDNDKGEGSYFDRTMNQLKKRREHNWKNQKSNKNGQSDNITDIGHTEITTTGD